MLTDSERRAIPFLRIWCLAELNCAVVLQKPLVISCGRHALDFCTRKIHVFDSNAPLLYHMQFLVSIEEAKAQYECDQVRILQQVKDGLGFEYVNSTVKSAICGAIVSSRCAVVRLASVGNQTHLNRLLEEWYCSDNTSAPKYVSEASALSSSSSKKIADLPAQVHLSTLAQY